MNQGMWAGIYRNWTWMGIPVMVIALAALGLLIAGLVTLVKRAQLFRVPPAERQEVHFAEAGQVILSIEGPRGMSRYKHINFELTAMNEERIEGRWTLFGARTTGISTVRVELLSYNIPKPGRYVLSMTGLGAAQGSDAVSAVVFTRPHMKQIVACILGILLAFGVFVTSLVFFVLRVFEKGPET
jgi:hypothetical protein